MNLKWEGAVEKPVPFFLALLATSLAGRGSAHRRICIDRNELDLVATDNREVFVLMTRRRTSVHDLWRETRRGCEGGEDSSRDSGSIGVYSVSGGDAVSAINA